MYLELMKIPKTARRTSARMRTNKKKMKLFVINKYKYIHIYYSYLYIIYLFIMYIIYIYNIYYIRGPSVLKVLEP